MKHGFLLLSCLSLIILSGCKPDQTPPEPEVKSSESTQTTGEKEPQTNPQSKQAASAAAKADQASKQCNYSAEPGQIKMEWTAYKFTDKTPVKGTFTSAQAAGPREASSLSALAKGLRMKIDGATIDSGDPGRNVTVKEFFFAKFNPPFQMEAWIKDLQGSDTEGNLTVVLQMNGVTKEVPFAYTATEAGEITAKGGINLMNWNLQPAFDSIHQACKTLHTGKDGVAKTWDVVDLKILGKFNKNCGS